MSKITFLSLSISLLFSITLSAGTNAQKLEELASLAKMAVTQSSGQEPFMVQVKDLSDAETFGTVTGLEAATFVNRIIDSYINRNDSSNVIRYAALITMIPSYAKHTTIDYLCVMTIKDDAVEFDQCTVGTRSHFPVFSSPLDYNTAQKFLRAK